MRYGDETQTIMEASAEHDCRFKRLIGMGSAPENA